MAIHRAMLYLAVASFLVVAPTGCFRGQRIALETENRRLGEESRVHLAELQKLKAHARTVEDKLTRAEDDLALYERQSGVDRKKLANYNREREHIRGMFGPGPDGLPAGVSVQLAQLAKRFPNLHIDPQTGISKLDTDILFDSGETELKPDAEQMLKELAGILETPEGKTLNVMVVGHTDDQRIRGSEARSSYPSNWHLSSARAVAVAERLRSAGLNEARMGVAGFAAHQPIVGNDSSESRHRNRRVEIFLTGPETPIVGMTETLSNLY